MAPVALSPQPLEAQRSLPPAKPIIKYSKRSRSSEEPPSSPPNKRARVTFSPRTDYKAFPRSEEREIARAREDVSFGLKNPRDSEEYTSVKSCFIAQPGTEDALSDNSLRHYLSVLINNATVLNRSHSDLIHAILQHQWLARDEQFVGLYTAFLGHLVSSQGGHLSQILKMLVENFVHLSTSAGYAPLFDGLDRRMLRDRVHKAMRYILRVVPSASSTLATIIRAAFPYADDSRKAHVQYVRNLLRLLEYCPELKSEVYDLVTDRLLKLDVEVQVDVDELEEDVGDLLAQGGSLKTPRELEPYEEDEDLPSDDDDDLDDMSSLDQDQQRLKGLTSTVEKMDALLDILFTSHNHNLKSADKLSRSSTFDLLLSQFNKTFLKTYRSRHTQFLLFHFAQTSPDYTNRFIDTCLNVLRSRTDNTSRISAAAYLGSFIARGAHISNDTVHQTFVSLADYAATLRKQYESNCRGPDRHRYDIYYATIQALIYIFCFRWRDLRSQATINEDEDDEDDVKEDDDEILNPIWPPHIKDAFTLNISSALNPLKVCAPEVVEEFARLAHRLGFLYIYPILNANRRIRLQGGPSRTASSSSIGGSGSVETALDHLRGDRHFQLDAYFPFDPYGLPVSKRWLEGDYRYWVDIDGDAASGQPSLSSGLPAAGGQAEESITEGENDSEGDEESDEGETRDEDEEEGETATATPNSEL